MVRKILTMLSRADSRRADLLGGGLKRAPDGRIGVPVTAGLRPLTGWHAASDQLRVELLQQFRSIDQMRRVE